MLHVFVCRNARCKWCDTTFFVQVNPDGTIPPPATHREKQFRALPAGLEKQMQTNLENLQLATEQKAKKGEASEWRGR
jgi:hypothetical protein